MADRFGVAPQFITPVLGSYSLCQLLAAPHWGRLSDRYGRRPILMSSLAGACLSYVMLGFAHNIWWLLASRMLAGLMAGNIAAAFAYASDVSTPEKRAGTLGLIGAAIGIGFTLGQPLGGLLAGPDAAHANFVAPAVLSTLTSLTAILLVRFVLPESHGVGSRAQQPPDEPRRGSWRLLRRTTGARPSRRLDARGDLFAGDTRVDLRDLGAAPLRLRAAHGRISALWRGVAGAADAGRGGARAGAAPRRGAPGDVGRAAVRGRPCDAERGTGARRDHRGAVPVRHGAGCLQPQRLRAGLQAVARARPRRGAWAPTWRAPAWHASSVPSAPGPCTRCSAAPHRSSSAPA